MKGFKRLGIVFMVLVVALAGIGAAFAHWSSTVTITETVTTGDVVVGIRDMGTTDDPGNADNVPNPGAGQAEWGPGQADPGWDAQTQTLVVYNKDVANTTSVNGTTVRCTKDSGDFYDSVTETLDNVYPSYAPTIHLEFSNCGSIPVKIKWTTTVAPLDSPLAPFVHIVKWVAYKDGVQIGSGANEDGIPTLLECMQIEPCQTIKLELTKHIKQEITPAGGDTLTCPMNATITYTHTVTGTQWNLADCPTPTPAGSPPV